MKQCPKCGVWMFEVDPQNEVEKCYNCGYERKIENVREYYIKNDVTFKLSLFSEKSVKDDKAFYFHSSSGVFIGEKATSLEEFANKIRRIDFESFKYHFVRGDFEKWIAEVIGNPELAEQIKKLRRQNKIDSKARNRLCKTVLTRL
jgi:DNA-directed RNA polymerase subunit M/transcription elongation factor TFIIS